MRIIFHECKKAFTSPILVVLILLFMAYNMFLIFSNSYFKEELKVVNELAETYGVKMTDESLHQFQQDLQKDFAKLNEITRKHTAQEFSSIDEFLNTLRYEDRDLYTEKEWAFFTQYQLKEMYFNLAKSIDSEYDRMNWKRMAKSEIEMYGLSGSAAKILQNEYDKISQRFEEMKENREHKTWFFAGKPYKVHSFLFRTVFGHLIFEALILIVLATALITNYEFENRTNLVTYSTKRGRRLMKDKLAASLLMATAITAFLFVITLGTYFSVFDYSYLWESSISSALNWEYNLPYVSWWNLSFLAFLLLSILLVYMCMILFSAITFVISIFVKNSYFTFFLFTVFFAMAYMMNGFMPQSSMLIFIAGFNLSLLVMNPHMFFMGSGGLMMFKFYEMITVGVWMMIVSVLCIFSFKKFNKQEIY
ncbi:hypothetical protein ACBP89_23825 [Aneurinibacillus aneurinilyticus]|uniref:hypothetical protein n=1 Tax=Aneurinibacillus aneurinilyticus TaxID=1391 RepID=UPI003524C643